MPSDGQAGQQSGTSRVAAVGPYIQSSTMPRGPARHDLPVKLTYPDGTATLPAHDPQSKASTGEEPEPRLSVAFHLLPQAFSFLTITQISAVANLAVRLHFVCSVILCIIGNSATAQLEAQILTSQIFKQTERTVLDYCSLFLLCESTWSVLFSN